MEKVIVFIDGSNLFFSLINKKIKTTFDYGKFALKLVGKNRRLVRAYYYDAALDKSVKASRVIKQQKFLEMLKKVNYYEVRYGRFFRGKQKGVDVRIAVDMIDFAMRNCYDTAILVSGDSDLVPAVELVKSTGKNVELAFFNKAYHLQQVSDKTTFLDKKFFSGL